MYILQTRQQIKQMSSFICAPLIKYLEIDVVELL